MSSCMEGESGWRRRSRARRAGHTSTPYGRSGWSVNEGRDDAALSLEVQLHAGDLGQADQQPRGSPHGRSVVRLKVEFRDERAARLEARLDVPLQPLDDALRLAVAGVEDAQTD